ncbi:MAG: GNAT family N-acetyltransferase [Pseudomonadota bacterium]
MIAPAMTLRAASRQDAAAMTDLVNFAGEGMPLYLWSGMATGGQSPWEIGRERAMRESGGFSYRNTTVCERSGRIAGALIGYPLDPEPDPDSTRDMPPMFVPLQELEDLAAGTWYVNVLAAYPEYRGMGVGTQLLMAADDHAARAGNIGLSIIVSDANTDARRLYERLGYIELASRPIVKDGWDTDGKNWVLLVKDRSADKRR